VCENKSLTIIAHKFKIILLNLASWISDKYFAGSLECPVQNTTLTQSIPSGIVCALLQPFQGNTFKIYHISSEHFLNNISNLFAIIYSFETVESELL